MNFFSIAFTGVGSLVALWGVVTLFAYNLNTGTFLQLLLGAVFICFGLLFEKFGRPLIIFAFAILIAVIVFTSFLLIYGKKDSAKFDEDTVIVLGAGLSGDKPGKTLVTRLDAAYRYHLKNPNAVFILSGGQGPQETITEALAMEKYLIDKGVPKDKIIKEEKATSTYENFKFSKEFAKGKICFITTDYHVFRAKLIAKSAGLEAVTYVHSNTHPLLILSSTLRECLAVTKYVILKK